MSKPKAATLLTIMRIKRVADDHIMSAQKRMEKVLELAKDWEAEPDEDA